MTDIIKEFTAFLEQRADLLNEKQKTDYDIGRADEADFISIIFKEICEKHLTD